MVPDDFVITHKTRPCQVSLPFLVNTGVANSPNSVCGRRGLIEMCCALSEHCHAVRSRVAQRRTLSGDIHEHPRDVGMNAVLLLSSINLATYGRLLVVSDTGVPGRPGSSEVPCNL